MNTFKRLSIISTSDIEHIRGKHKKERSKPWRKEGRKWTDHPSPVPSLKEESVDLTEDIPKTSCNGLSAKDNARAPRPSHAYTFSRPSMDGGYEKFCGLWVSKNIVTQVHGMRI